MTSHAIALPLRLLSLLLLLLASGRAQPAEEITVEWIYGGGPQSVAAVPRHTWLQDGDLLLEGPGGTWERMEPASGQRSLVLDRDEALQSLEQALGRKPRGLPWPTAFDASGRRALYAVMGDILVLDLPSATFSWVARTPTEETSVRFSPDGNRLSFVRENDLYVHDLKSGATHRLTHDGSDLILNGTLPWVYWEEIFGREDLATWWSPDSEAIAFLRSDQSLVTEVVHLDFQPAVPRVIRQRYPKVGTANPVVRVGVVAAEGSAPVWVTLGERPPEYIVRVKWLPGGDRLSVQTLDRNHQRLDLFFADAKTGQSEHILSETDAGWINVHDDLYFLADGQHFLWVSERDGWSHLYRYTLDGKLANRVTEGPWALHAASPIFWLRQAVRAIDEEAGLVYFGALRDSPLEDHLYRVHLDGSGLEKVSSEPGTHAVEFSPDARFYLDEHSNARTPPALTLHTADGKPAGTLLEPRTDRVQALGIVTPELFTIPARDGFPLPAYLYKPRDFDPARRYPLILNPYGGPSSRSVTDSWGQDIYFNQVLLRKGYLVACVDNRSATGISKTLENTIKGQMTGDGELNDLLDGVRWFKEQSYVDPARVGIWGWSNGGMMTLLAMTRSTEFKAGISVAPVTDWTYYDTIWAETVMKLPADNPEGYRNTNLVQRAKDLHGHLLLVHGTYDDNVHVQNTWHFVDELVKAGKLFELMVYPMRQHGIADRPARIHLFRTMVDFWTRNL